MLKLVKKSMIIGYRYNPYTDPKTGEFRDTYQVYVVNPIILKDGVHSGYAWNINYKSKSPSYALNVPKEEFDSWFDMFGADLIGTFVDCFYNQYGTLVKVNPVIIE